MVGEDDHKEGQNDEVLAKVQRLIERAGGANEAVMTLLSENAQYRERLRVKAQELEAEKKRVPEGAVVLSGDELTAYQSYQALGTPDELKTAKQKLAEAETELFTERRNVRLRDAATITGFDPEVLDSLARTADGTLIDFELIEAEVERDGKRVKERVPHVKVGDTSTRLTEYAEQHWQKFMPSLKPADEGQPPPAGRRLPNQHGHEGGRPPRDKGASFYHRPKL